MLDQGWWVTVVDYRAALLNIAHFGEADQMLNLAAGDSNRFETPKQLLNWQGKTLLKHAIQIVEPFLKSRIIVVFGSNAEAISAVELNHVKIIKNSDWQEGIASSIRSGIEALPTNASAVLIMLGDQPLISTIQIYSLLVTWHKQPKMIVASSYNGTIGVPAIFPSDLFYELKLLNGKVGAKSLFYKHSDKVVSLPLAGAALDIATRVDYLQ
jgi:molybdenum cofactor cytidylyltransferase